MVPESFGTSVSQAALVEAQWQGALNQWGIEPEGSLVDFVTQALASWFSLVTAGGLRQPLAVIPAAGPPKRAGEPGSTWGRQR